MGKKTKKSVSIGEYIIESGEEWQAKAYKIPRSVWAALKECARKHGFEFTPEKETTHSLGWKLLKEFCDGANSGTIGEYHIERKENGHINLYVEYKNTIGALREVARHLDGLEWDEKWNTRSAGRRIVDYALEHPELILKKAKEITTIGEYVIEIKDRKVRVYKEPRSAFAALRECAAKHKFEFTPEKETTHSLGWKLLKEFCDGANIGTIGEYHIERKENGHIDISVEYKNAIKALREMAKLLEGFEWDETWTTFDVARKVVEYALEHPEHVKKVKREKKAPVTKHTVGSTSSDIDHEALTEVDDDELEEDYEDEDDDGETHDIEYYMEMAQVSDDDLKNAWTDGSGVMYSADKKRLLKAPNELTDDYAVLPGTQVICDDAFVKAYDEVIMPYGLKYIGKRAFRESEFYNIKIPESVILVGDQAFQYCVNADSLAIGKNTEVGRFAFMGTDFSFGTDVVDSVIELTLKPLKGKLSNDSIGEILANIGEEDKPCGKTKLMFGIDLDENTTRYVWSHVGDWGEELLSEFVRKVDDFCQKTLGKSVDEVVDYEAYYVSSIKELAGDYWTVEEMLDGVAYAIRKMDEGDDYDPSMNDENEAYYNGFNSSTEDKFHLGNVLFGISWGDGGESNLFLDVRNDVSNFDGTGNYGIAAPYQDICDRLRMVSLLFPGYSKDEDEGDADEDADADNEDEE